MKRLICIVVVLIVQARAGLAEGPVLSVCSFNIQFLGGSKDRDNAGLAAVLKAHDVVVVQELVAPPFAGKFPDGHAFVPDIEARRFFEFMKAEGFTYQLSEEDTGSGLKNHLNSSSTEWWVAFYKTNAVKLAPDLPGGFLAKQHAGNKDFDRVPYAFAFRSIDDSVDFVLISVHLRPGAGLLHKKRRKGELGAIAKWIAEHNQKEKDFIILGDMNIENFAELTNAIPAGMTSLNQECRPTNTNVKGPKPYDHVMLFPAASREVDAGFGLHIENLIEALKPRWKKISTSKYPGQPYNHNKFRKYYSDHNPVDFRIRCPVTGDDD